MTRVCNSVLCPVWKYIKHKKENLRLAFFVALAHRLFVSDRIGLFSLSWWACSHRPFVFFLKGYIPFFLFFCRNGIYPEETDCEQSGLLRIGNWPVPFLCNPIERQTHSLVPCCNFYTVAFRIFLLPCLSLCIGSQKLFSGSLRQQWFSKTETRKQFSVLEK